MALLQGSTPNLQGSTGLLQGSSYNGQTTPQPVGVKAISLVSKVVKPPNTLPPTQAVPTRDLSSTYGQYSLNGNPTIYNKTTNTAFSNQGDFLKEIGDSAWGNYKFDTAYTPPTSNSATQTPPAPAVLNSTSYNSGPYTPPNQGTTGVSQGGLIGNLVNKSNQPSQAYLDATKNVNDVLAKQNALTSDYATQNADILSRPEGLTQQGGEQGILANLYATKQAGLSSQYQGATNQLNAANAQQGLQVQAGTAAGTLNAPITGVPYGTQTIQPSQPNGSTTSGASNLSALVGTRVSAVDGKTQEYFDKQTGQGFPNPQALADFVNRQLGSNQANAQNVFDLINSSGQGQSGGALNPLNNVQSLAQQVIAGTISPSQAYSMGGNVANFQGVLNQAIQSAQPGFDLAAAQGKFDAKQTTSSNQGQQVASYQSAYQQGQVLQSQLKSLLTSKGVNPNDVNAVNSVIQSIAKNTSDPSYQTFQNLINDIAARYSVILTPSGGSTTDYQSQIAHSLLDATASGQSIIQVMQSLDQQAQGVINRVITNPNPSTYTNNSTSSSGSGSYNFQ